MPDAPVSILPTPSAGGAPASPVVILDTPSAGGAPASPVTILPTPSAGGAPASPAVILATPSAGGAPASPAVILATPSAGGAPASPVTILGTPSAVGSPASPAAVLEVAVTSGAVTCIISGTLAPDATGELVPVETLSSLAYPASDQWSADGANAAPSEGIWVQLYTARLITPESATLEAIMPKANYVATGSQSTASKVAVLQLGVATKVYWLYDQNDGNPATSKWVDAADGTMADQGATVIPAGRMLLPTNRLTMGGFLGGLGATWEAASDAQWLFVIAMHEDGAQTGLWYGQGGSPSTATWSPQSGSTGVPTVSLSGILPPASVLP